MNIKKKWSTTSPIPVVLSGLLTSASSLLSIQCKMSTSAVARSTVVNEENINQNIKNMEYAVRGPLVIRATEIEKELASVRICRFCVFYKFCRVITDTLELIF